jgi:hypothetical protein
MAGTDTDYNALAQQAGAVASTPAPSSTPVATSAAAPTASSPDIDYMSLARQAGAVNSTPAPENDPFSKVGGTAHKWNSAPVRPGQSIYKNYAPKQSPEATVHHVAEALPAVGGAIGDIAGEGVLSPVTGAFGAAAGTQAERLLGEHPTAKDTAKNAAIYGGTELAMKYGLPVALKYAGKLIDELKPEWLLDRFTKLPEVPAPQHGAPLSVQSPLDSATVGSKLGGKDLSQEALDALHSHVGDKIPVGSTAKNTFMKAVEPVTKTISDTSSELNKIIQNAPDFQTSIFDDNVSQSSASYGKLQQMITDIKSGFPPSVRKTLTEDVDGVMTDAEEALKSKNPADVLEARRVLGKKIDWDAIEKNPSTPKEAQNLARVKVYHALGDKIHAEIPETVPLDKTLQPNLELKSHMTSKLGERVVDDPQAATAEAQSEFRKGQEKLFVDDHNAKVSRNRKIAAEALGIPAAGVTGALVEHYMTKH